jgi:NADPH-dependent 2,4-dienoyl-CoA reductase/sulfur reductase-like enzyme
MAAGGASVAARLRRLSESWQITIIEKGPYVSYANCGLPYFVGNVIRVRARILVLPAGAACGALLPPPPPEPGLLACCRVQEESSLLVATPEKFKSWFNVEVAANTEVVSINCKVS